MVGRLFQGLEQRVEGVAREHVHLVDDINLVARRDGAITHAVDNLADVVHTGVAGGIHLHHIDMPVLGDRAAIVANPARIDRGATGTVNTYTVETLGDDPRRGRLADTTYPGQNEGVRQTPLVQRVLQGADERFLTYEIVEALGAVLAGKNPIGPDRVGEEPVHPNLPEADISGPGGRLQGPNPISPPINRR